MYITGYFVDANDAVPETLAPLRNGPALPIATLVVDAIDTRQVPPQIIGTLPDGTVLPAACAAIDETTHTALLADLAQWRAVQDAAQHQQALQQLAEYRYRIETGGVDIAGQHILTDRESQAQLNGALQALTSGFVTAVDWKAAGGWVQVTLEVIQPIGAAVAQHVQACFTAERQVAEQMALGPLPTDMASAFDAALASIVAASAG